ncbi:MAG: hypothetical protein NC936_06210, partial [Candidatus Omnitrophica bacterium]|nr:hypothetical protein [Candidatus Omnitrophota bacterium]
MRKEDKSILQHLSVLDYGYQFKRLKALGVTACFSNRRIDLGFSSPATQQNRNLFLESLGIK